MESKTAEEYWTMLKVFAEGLLGQLDKEDLDAVASLMKAGFCPLPTEKDRFVYTFGFVQGVFATHLLVYPGLKNGCSHEH